MNPADQHADGSTGRPRRHAPAPWKVNLRWTVGLLALWFGSTFCLSWYARELRFDFFGWPFSFWAGAQGLLLLYVGMAALYAWRMNRADRLSSAQADAEGQGEGEGEGEGSRRHAESSQHR